MSWNEIIMWASIPLNFAIFFCSTGKLRYMNLVAGIFPLALLGLVAIDNYMSGCWSAPKKVEFHQGMTICPGQTATFTLGDLQ